MRRCKNWAQKIFSCKYLTIWRPVLPVFPRAQVPHSWSPPWTPFRGCWKSAVATACDLILVEAEGKWQFFVGSVHCSSLLSGVHGVDGPQFVYLFTQWKTFELFPVFVNYEYNCCKHSRTGVTISFHFSTVNTDCWIVWNGHVKL